VAISLRAQSKSCGGNEEQLDRICEGLVDKKDELESLEAKVAGSMEQFSEIKYGFLSRASNAEMEKLERELQQMRITTQNGLLQLEQRFQSV
jgi:kinetochore protein NDC80